MAGCWWLMPIILAIQEAEIRRIAVQSHKKELAEWLKVKTLSSSPSTKKEQQQTKPGSYYIVQDSSSLSTCLRFSSAGIMRVYHHAYL
jgi:hypothetical protein